MVYDPESGQLLTGSLMDYAVPRADAVAGDFATEIDTRMPCLTNPLGVKGVGELGTIGATPASSTRWSMRSPRPARAALPSRCRCRSTSEQVWRALAGDYPASPL